jgi:hypothetical protein
MIKIVHVFRRAPFFSLYLNNAYFFLKGNGMLELSRCHFVAHEYSTIYPNTKHYHEFFFPYKLSFNTQLSSIPCIGLL